MGFVEHKRRMGMWNASVLVVTSARKKRYWKRRGWAWRIAAFVVAPGERGSFSIRAHVK